ncbi:MAG: ABC transporter permease subunit [Erysipelotrichales bacterium]
MKNRLLYYSIGIIIFHLIWYVAAITIETPALVDPILVYNKVFFNFDSYILVHTLASLKRIFISVLISMSIALILTLLMNEFKIVNNILKPLVYLLYPIPKTALLPILMTIQGLGNASKITLLVLIIVFQTIIYLQDALDNVKEDDISVLKSLGATRLQTMRHVKLPSILSSIIASIKVNIAGAFGILFLIETYGSDLGLGYYIQDAWNKINYVDMYYGIVISGFVCLFIFLIIDTLENKLIKRGYYNR